MTFGFWFEIFNVSFRFELGGKEPSCKVLPFSLFLGPACAVKLNHLNSLSEH